MPVLVAIYNVEDAERVRARRLSVVGPRITIGRAADCTIVVDDDDRVIEHHLEIELRTGDYILTPRGTTTVNDALISGPTTCGLGATIRIGKTIVKLRPEQAFVKTVPRHDRSAPPQRQWPVEEVTPRHVVGIELNPPPPQPDDRPTPVVPMDRPLRMAANPPRPNYNPPMPQPLEPLGPYLPTQIVPPPKVFRARLSADDAEHELLATLRGKPDDAGYRMVYADWLEDHGFLVRAQITRGDDVDPGAMLDESTAEWRAIASCTHIDDCTFAKCPQSWSRMTAVADDERVRQCRACHRMIRYCVHVLDPHGAETRNEGIVLDVSVDVEGSAGDTLDDPPRRIP